jgi:hypothetical protein
MAQNRHTDRLAKIVEKSINEAPFLYEGQAWAAATLDEWANSLGVSKKTLQRAIRAPIVSKPGWKDGHKVTLLRLGTPGKPTLNDRARHLQNIWRKKIGTHPNFGLCKGLVQAWGDEAPILLRLVIDNWSEFMAGTKIAMVLLADEGKGSVRFYEYPSLSVILRFNAVVVEMQTTRKQALMAKAA